MQIDFSPFCQNDFSDTPRLIILLNQPIPRRFATSLLCPGNTVIAVDGGANHLKDYDDSITPHCIVGDLDSLTDETRRFYERRSTLIVHKPEQDSDDFQKAICWLHEVDGLGFTSAIVLGAFGGNFSQSLGNVGSLFHDHGPFNTLFLCDQHNVAIQCRENVRYEFSVEPLDSLCALLPINGPCIVSTSGLKWDLSEARLAFGELISTSNRTVSSKVHVECKDNSVLWLLDFRTSAQKPAFLLDIDGVLIRGQRKIPEAIEALNLLEKHKIEYYFMTNGGGKLHSNKADSLASVLGRDIDVNRVTMCHDCIGEALPAQGRVLFCGVTPENAWLIAKDQFQLPESRIVVLEDLTEAYSHHLPRYRANGNPSDRPPVSLDEPFVAIAIMSTPRDWDSSYQIFLDLLLCGGQLNGSRSSAPQIPVFVANPDFDYPAESAIPRITTGAYIHGLVSLAKHYGMNVECTVTGKPSPMYYQHCIRKIRGDCTVYMVGDNPESDIQGARAAGIPSILVRTGKFQGEINDAKHPADYVVKNILQGVQMVLKKHQYV